jgi:hydroxymethylbilane synthase
VLACAGLNRMGWVHRITQALAPAVCVPAAGQGALAVQCRADDVETRELLAAIDDQATRQAVLAERSFLRAVGGGCRVPIGVYGEVVGGVLRLQAMLAVDSGEVVRAALAGPADRFDELSSELAHRVVEAAGPSFLAEVRGG